MITIKIGTAERSDGDIDAKWIQKQVNSRRQSGEKICVHFSIQCDDTHLNLVSRACKMNGGGSGISRMYNRKEKHFLDEWMKRGFSDQDINAGMVVSFWKLAGSICF